MQSNNPVFSRAPEFSGRGYAGFDERGATRPAPASSGPGGTSPSLEDMYAAPSASPVQTGRMTYDDVVIRTGMMLLAVGAFGVVGWMMPGLMLIGLIGGLVLGLVNAFKREPSPVLILAYAALQGLFLGGISAFFNAAYEGIVVQAVLATVTTFAVMLGLYRSRVLRATPKFTKVLIGAVIGYALFSLVKLVLAMTGVADLRTGMFGLLIGAVGAVLAALSLVLDFDFIERGVNAGIPQRDAWTAAFGLVVTLIWLYIEFLRILSILHSDD